MYVTQVVSVPAESLFTVEGLEREPLVGGGVFCRFARGR